MTEKKHRTGKEEESAKPNDDAFVIEELKTKLNEFQQQIDAQTVKSGEYFDGWQRERADFMNYKRRIERDQQLNHQNMVISITKKYLAVLDDIDRALKARPTEAEGAKWAEGIELISRKLNTALESDGVKEMEVSSGSEFDPTFHEALTHEDSSAHQSGQIIEVIQKGYLIGDRVLRPALVRVAR
jgi:molecular chaperone GrpE